MKKNAKQYAILTLAVAGVLASGQALASVVDFTAGEGYTDGEITDNVAWNGDTNNIVATAGAGYSGATGLVTMSPASDWATCIYTNPVTLATAGDTIILSTRFQYSATGTVMPGNQSDIVSLQFFDDSTVGVTSTNFVRLAIRRTFDGSLRFFMGIPGLVNGGLSSGLVAETAVGMTPAATTTSGTSAWLQLTAALTKGSSSNDWKLTASITNLATASLVLSNTFNNIAPSAAFQDDAVVYGGFNSSQQDSTGEVFNRIMDTFGIASAFIAPPPAVVTIIGAGGSIGVPSSGNGNFEAKTGAAPAANTQWPVSEMPSWHNLSGAETQTSGSNQGLVGSPEANSYGAYLFPTFVLGNDTPYTISAAGQAFNVSLALHKFGSAGNYNGDEAAVVTLFTSTSGVTDDTILGDITVLGRTSFPVTGSWIANSATAFYTTTAGDVGKTVYLGITLTNLTSPDVFPRVDVVKLTVTLPTVTCAAPTLSIARNGANVDVSWPSSSGCSYQLQTNGTLTGVWGNHGSPVSGDGTTKTASVPVSGSQLYFRAQVQ